MLNKRNDALSVPLEFEFEPLAARPRLVAGDDVEPVDAERGTEFGARLALFRF